MRKARLGIKLIKFTIHGSENKSIQSGLISISSNLTKFKNDMHDVKVYIAKDRLNKVRNTVNNTVNSLEFSHIGNRFILGRYSTTKNINIRPYAVM